MSRAFRFRLEPVRQLREQAEDAAKEDLASALTERRRQEELRSVAEQRLHGARDASRPTAGAPIDVSAIAAHQAFIERSEREARAAADVMAEGDPGAASELEAELDGMADDIAALKAGISTSL